MKKKNVVSIFSGIDVMGLGFETVFSKVLAVEWNKQACGIMEHNRNRFFPHSEVWCRDIYEIRDEEILRFQGMEGLIGGPQCQPFSPAKHFDPSDDRIRGLWEYLRWVRLLQPTFFVFENSFGLVQRKKKVIFERFKQEAEGLGYEIHDAVLNAHDYGNPQNRKRLIAVGIQKKVGVPYQFPTPIPLSERKYVKDILREEPLGPCMSYSPNRKEIIHHVPEGGYWKHLPTEELKLRALGEKNYAHPQGGMTGTYRRLHRDKPLPTLLTHPGQRNTMLTHPWEDRPLSVGEYKRGMGIPENYELLGSVQSMYRCIGNAVPFELARAIAESLIHSLYPH